MMVGRYWYASGVGLLLGLWGCGYSASPTVRAPGLPRDRERAERLNAQGLALVAQGDRAGAEERLRAALEADPYAGAVHSNLGVVLLQLGKPYDAGWHLRNAIRLMPRASQPRANLGILYEAVGKFGAAEEELRTALGFSPDDIEIIGHLARVHVRQDKHTADTLAWLQRLATEDDDPAWRGWAREQLIRVGNGNPRDGR